MYIRNMLSNHLTHIQLLNLNLPKGILPLKENNDALEGRIRRKVSETVKKYATMKGRRKYDYLTEKAILLIFRNEVRSIGDLLEKEKQIQNNSHWFVKGHTNTVK